MGKHLLLILAIISLTATGQINFKRQKEYGRMSISNEDFKKLVKTIHYYHGEQSNDTTKHVIPKYDNGQPVSKGILDLINKPYYSISMEINDGGQTQELSSFDDIDKLDLDGHTYDRLNLTYINLNQPISEIRITFNNSYRNLSIGGSEKRKVDGVYRDLDEQLSERVSTFSFIRWDMIFSSLLFLSFLFAMIIVISASASQSADAKKYLYMRIICGIYVAVCIIYFLSTYDLADFFPQFQLKPDDTAWWDRYGNLIGVIGFFGSVYFGVVKIIRQLIAPAATANSETLNTSTQNPDLQAHNDQSDQFEQSRP